MRVRGSPGGGAGPAGWPRWPSGVRSFAPAEAGEGARELPVLRRAGSVGVRDQGRGWAVVRRVGGAAVRQGRCAGDAGLAVEVGAVV